MDGLAVMKVPWGHQQAHHGGDSSSTVPNVSAGSVY